MAEQEVSRVNRADAALVLGVLSAVEQDSRVTQRGLSSELGIALGLANAVLKRCARKGLIKIAAAPLNRYAYYLTPSGFAEKTRLTVEYLSLSFDLFRDARRQYTALFAELAADDRKRVALLGVSDLTEMAMLSAREAGIEVTDVVDAARANGVYLGVATVADVHALAGRVDAMAVCDMSDPVATYDSALACAAELGIDRDRVVAPALLRLGWRRSRQEAER